jgi:hypothetical protein
MPKYTDDTLNRLASAITTHMPNANAPAWGTRAHSSVACCLRPLALCAIKARCYDKFGNLGEMTVVKGSAPYLNIGITRPTTG